MSADASEAAEFVHVMNGTGFYRDGRPGTGVLTGEGLLDPASDRHFKYKTAVDKLEATAFFELSGSPCIYFKYLADGAPSDERLTEIHSLAWNHGLAPILWVVTPTSVRIYNCYSRPQTIDPSEHKRHVIRFFADIADSLETLNRFAGRLQYETGGFWRTHEARRIDRRQRVDESLLSDLKAAEQDLMSAGLPASVAHALLGRSIFVAYLQDRQILKPQFFRSGYREEKFTDVLRDGNKTERLWDWIRETFNGDLFPLDRAERRLVRPRHLRIVRRLLEGTSRSGQMRLWPYRFDVIPVELISSIYEMFTRSADEKGAERLSTHYTPMNLVDLVLSEVFKGMPPKGKVGDFSCGSGVFLVEALRRLVSLRLAKGETLSRKLIREVLHGQVFGVDISEEAIQIAAFSLYLTLLELDPDPRPPSALKFRELVGQNLFAEDAFGKDAAFPRKEPFASKDLAAIVGNPPWTRTPPGSSNAEYCQDRGHPTARKGTPDQAFLWRIGDFASDNTRIGLILHAKHLFSHEETARKAKQALLQRFTPELMLNLSELRQLRLFPATTAPAIIFIAKGRPPSPSASFAFAAARRYDDFRGHGIVEITPDCIKRLPLRQAACDPDMLKVASWGSARDMELIRRLRSRPGFIELGALADRLHWAFGRGVEPGGSTPADFRFPKKFLSSGAMPRFAVDPSRLPDRDPDLKLRRGHSRPEIYKGPLLIVTRGLRDQRFYSAVAEHSVLYTQLYVGFSAAAGHPELLHLLNGILNAKLSAYFLFMTGSSWGVERSTVELVDVSRMLVPALDLSRGRAGTAITRVEQELVQAALAGSECESLLPELDEAVFSLYGLGEEERVLVEEVLEITIGHRRDRDESEALRRPTPQDLTAYAEQLRAVVSPLLRTRQQRGITAEILDAGACPLATVRFGMVPASRDVPVTVTDAGGLDSILRRIEGRLRNRITDRVLAKRFLRVYAPDELYVIKPAELRYWSRSAALNDADEILAEHLGDERGMQ